MSPAPRTKPAAADARLQDLVPIAVVIAAGCEPCAEKMVNRALEQGSAAAEIRELLRIVEQMQRLDCLTAAVGPEVVSRMAQPLERAYRTLEAEGRSATEADGNSPDAAPRRSAGVREAVREAYGKRAGAGGCCEPASGPADHEAAASRMGYTADEIAVVPEGANLGLGCGAPLRLAAVAAGETVLDLGSGAGFDALIAAQEVGPTGRVIGVDMTAEMLEKARGNAARAGVANVEFREGLIEALPVDDESVDVVVSNCVINLSPDKEVVFREAFRVLRPGGRLAVADIVLTAPLPEAVTDDLAAYVGCVAGAAMLDEYLEMIGAAGFDESPLVRRRPALEALAPDDGVVRAVTDGIGGCCGGDATSEEVARSVLSVEILARKPAP